MSSDAIRPTVALYGEDARTIQHGLQLRFHVVAAESSGRRVVLPPGVAVVVAVRPGDVSFPDIVPLVVVGGTPPAAAACWFGKVPSIDVLSAVVRDLVHREPASEPPRSWRRKSDLIIGSSQPIRQLLDKLDRLAQSAAPVLITGESGTGKELVARALHFGSSRASAPFVAINCAAIPESLFEAELFGHQRGAFTGAVASRAGAFEAADRGTLLLDEIGEMPLPLQAKLLRVLETGEITRLGSVESKRVTVRLVTATNRSLEAEVERGTFRQDLYYRVGVHSLHVPPLRERFEDIPALVHHHLEEIARREKHATVGVTPTAIDRLLSYRWPGNVRELVNVLERALLYAKGGMIDAPEIVLPVSTTPLIAPYRDAKEQFELLYYSQVLRAAGGNISRVAKLSQKTRKEVYDAMRRLGMDVGDYRESGQFPVATPVDDEDTADDG